jgi:hypothetical protein
MCTTTANFYIVYLCGGQGHTAKKLTITWPFSALPPSPRGKRTVPDSFSCSRCPPRPHNKRISSAWCTSFACGFLAEPQRGHRPAPETGACTRRMSTASACTSTFEARILAQWCIYPAEDRKPVGFSLCQRHSVHQPFQTDAAVDLAEFPCPADFHALHRAGRSK